MSETPFEVETRGDTSTVKLRSGFLDLWTAPVVGQELAQLVQKSDQHTLCLDLEQVGYLTAAGLSVAVALHQQLRDRGGELILCNARGNVYEVFRLSGLAGVLDVRPRETTLSA